MKNPLSSLQFGWHTRRAIVNIVRDIRDTVVRRGTQASKFYQNIKAELVLEEHQQARFRLANRVANAIENGHRAYNWGMKVLENNLGGKNRYDKNGNQYRRIVMPKRHDGEEEQILTISAKVIRNSGFSKWRMPTTKGAGLMKKAFYAKRETYRKIIKDAVRKDLELDRQRKKSY